MKEDLGLRTGVRFARKINRMYRGGATNSKLGRLVRDRTFKIREGQVKAARYGATYTPGEVTSRLRWKALERRSERRPRGTTLH